MLLNHRKNTILFYMAQKVFFLYNYNYNYKKKENYNGRL